MLSNRQGYDADRWFPPDQDAADDFDRYSRDFPAQHFRQGTRRVRERAKAFLFDDTSAAQIADFFRDRIQRGTPTSAIRISDGEGNVLFAEETAYPGLRAYVLSKISRMHFGRRASTVPDNADLFLTQMREAIAEADVYGMPDPRKVIRSFQREPAVMDTRAQTGNRKGLATAIRLAETDGLHDKMIANAFFSRQIESHYPSILSTARVIVLVTCHPDLPDAIRRLSGVQDVRLIDVPLQSSQMHGAANEHFPDAYRRICRDIPQQPPGALFLIGAGPLAKYYCALAKRAGGIAIDVGAVMDFWIGRSGRGTIKQEMLDEWSIMDK